MINLDPPWHCCDHCDHMEPDYDPAIWRHEDPCPHGCNAAPEGEKSGEASRA